MSKAWLTVFLLCCTFVFGRQVPQRHRDYVPDAATAQRIAEAVLIGQYGDERVKDQLPLRVDGSNGDYWIVQGLSLIHIFHRNQRSPRHLLSAPRH